jgi:hypothetical protein
MATFSSILFLFITLWTTVNVVLSSNSDTNSHSVPCVGGPVKGMYPGETVHYDAIVAFHSDNEDRDGKTPQDTDNNKIRLGQSLRYHFLILETNNDGSCTIELSISRYDIVQKLTKYGEWIKSSSSATATENNEVLNRVPSLKNPFYFTIGNDGRISQVHYLPGDDERTIAL